MKRCIVYLVLIVCLAEIVNAANVGVIARLKDSTEQSWCLSVKDGSTAKDALDATDLDLVWSGTGPMAYLITVNGIQSDYDNNGAWSFWHQNSNGNAFEESSVGFGGYTVNPSGTSIGLSYSAYDPVTYQFLTPPSFLPYDGCIGKLKIKGIKAYVDGKKESGADEDGGKINVVPGSKLELKITVENLYDKDDNIGIEDIAIGGILEGIGDGKDLEDEATDFSLNPGRDKEASLKFNIPLEVEDGDYDLTVTIEGENENGFSYSKEIEFEVEVDKEKHDIIFSKLKFSNDNAECGKSAILEVNAVNFGVNDEDVKLAISSEELGVNLSGSFELSHDPFSKDNSFSKAYKIMLPSGISSGIYALRAGLFYGNDIESSAIELNVKCNDLSNVASKEISSAVNNPTPKNNNPAELKIKTMPAEISGAAASAAAEGKKISNKDILMVSVFAGEILLLIGAVALLIHLRK